jgi:DNA mismatch repair ATPase MutS
LLLLVLHLGGVTAIAWWIVPVLINVLITVRVRRAIHGVFRRAGAGDRAFRAYAKMLQVANELDGGDTPWIVEAKRTWGGHQHPPHVEMTRLLQILAAADNRFSQLYPIIQGLFLWDIHVLDFLERWQQRCGRDARRWIATLGELEGLCGLARLADDHPDWTFPAITDETILRAEGIGHPLMHPGRAVTNDVTIGPRGTFLLVTGSNMSGKSTLLRAIGVNTVLGLAGGPVCAQRLELPQVRVWTSMRVRDSLDQGVSYFMAGLRRLKAVVEAARDNGAARPPVLFLLDEILQGTNTAERLVAVRGVVSELVERGAIGAVTTHDLALAEAPELKDTLEAVHFTESFQPGPNGGITFDYKLRPGVATSRNALRLMELMGLRHP